MLSNIQCCKLELTEKCLAFCRRIINEKKANQKQNETIGCKKESRKKKKKKKI